MANFGDHRPPRPPEFVTLEGQIQEDRPNWLPEGEETPSWPGPG